MGKQGFYRNRQIAYDWLKSTFPAIFRRDTPLKLGIHRDILVFEDENKPANVHIRHAIAIHVSRSAYLARMKEGVERIDLEGLGCDQFVSEEEAVAAKEKRRALHEHFKAKKKERNEPSQEETSRKVLESILSCHSTNIVSSSSCNIIKQNHIVLFV